MSAHGKNMSAHINMCGYWCLFYTSDFPSTSCRISTVASKARPISAGTPCRKRQKAEKVQPAVARLPEVLLWAVPWVHCVILTRNVEGLARRRCRVEQFLAHGGSCISTYELTWALPKQVQSALPTVEQIEAELGATLRRIGHSEVPKPKKSGRNKKGGGE